MPPTRNSTTKTTSKSRASQQDGKTSPRVMVTRSKDNVKGKDFTFASYAGGARKSSAQLSPNHISSENDLLAAAEKLKNVSAPLFKKAAFEVKEFHKTFPQAVDVQKANVIRRTALHYPPFSGHDGDGNYESSRIDTRSPMAEMIDVVGDDVQYSPAVAQKDKSIRSRASKQASVGEAEIPERHDKKRKVTFSPDSQEFPMPRVSNGELLGQLDGNPIVLPLSTICGMFHILQERTRSLAERAFGFWLTPEQQAAWPLHELETEYPGLYHTTRYIADGSGVGWHTFFTSNTYRPYLVYGILGEWFNQRIFKHTAFGLPQRHINEIEVMEKRYLNHDAIVRSKKRAAIIEQVFSIDGVYADEASRAMSRACHDLADELLVVLEPLLPPEFFNPLRPFSDEEIKDSKFQSRLQILTSALSELIRACAALHLSIRVTGRSGVIIRTTPHIQKGTPYSANAPMVCINLDELHKIPHNDTDHLVVKMTCWPRIEATVPHGPDMLELASHEKHIRQDIEFRERVQDGFKRRKSTEQGQGQRYNSTKEANNFDWKLYEDRVWPLLPQSLKDSRDRDVGRDRRQSDGEQHRGSYVSFYPSVCEAAVYCEWAPRPNIKDRHHTKTTTRTLADTIKHARASHPNPFVRITLELQDAFISVWNFYAKHNISIEYSALIGLATLYLGWRGTFTSLGVRLHNIVGQIKPSIFSYNNFKCGFDHTKATAMNLSLIQSPSAVLLRQIPAAWRGALHLPLTAQEVACAYTNAGTSLLPATASDISKAAMDIALAGSSKLNDAVHEAIYKASKAIEAALMMEADGAKHVCSAIYSATSMAKGAICASSSSTTPVLSFLSEAIQCASSTGSEGFQTLSHKGSDAIRGLTMSVDMADEAIHSLSSTSSGALHQTMNGLTPTPTLTPGVIPDIFQFIASTTPSHTDTTTDSATRTTPPSTRKGKHRPVGPHTQDGTSTNSTFTGPASASASATTTTETRIATMIDAPKTNEARLGNKVSRKMGAFWTWFTTAKNGTVSVDVV